MLRVSTLISDGRVTAALSALRKPPVHLALLGAFGLLGWGAFAQSTSSSASTARELQAQVQRLALERDQAKQDLSAARQEIVAVTKRLSDAMDRVNQTGTLATPPVVKTGARPPERPIPNTRTKL